MTEQIARALGMELWETPSAVMVSGTNKSLQAYLDSPAGEKAVRDRVRELWRDYQGEYGRREVAEFENVGDLCGQVQLLEWDHGGREGHTVKFSYATIILARQAALLWLAEQAEKGGK